MSTFGRCYDNKKMQLESQFHELTNRFHHYPVLFCSLFCISSMFSFYLTYDFLYTNTFLQLINDIRKYSHNIFKVFRESEISFQSFHMCFTLIQVFKTVSHTSKKCAHFIFYILFAFSIFYILFFFNQNYFNLLIRRQTSAVKS